MSIIIDGSSALSAGRDAAVEWLCDYAVDGILQEGDRLTLWLASDPAQKLFSGVLSGTDSKETVKSLFRSLNPQGSAADYATALKEAAKNEAAAEGMSCTFIISGSRAGYNSFPRDKKEAAMLRYSRVLDFSGWRVFVVSQKMGDKVRRAAAAFVD
ncbi:MAG: hypothetical protein LBU18_00450 [Treponema sp.]|nr:hypothetical protein [Treponema sp.]